MLRKLFVALVLTALVAAPSAFAALTGSISGVALDKSGQPLPGVGVTVTSPVLQGTRTAVTRPDGTFIIPNLPPGAQYKVVLALSGFKSAEYTSLNVRIDQDTQVNAVLEISATAEVVVTGEAPVVDVTKTNTGTNLSTDYLRKVPIGSAGRSYQGVLQQTAGVVGGGNPNVLGGNILENSFLIDGINTTDPVTHTFSFNLNFDAIQEIGLQTSGFAAEYGRASGGIVNVVTKSGGNDFHGSFDIRYSDNNFNESGDHFDADLSATRNTPWTTTLGGPIMRDRLWFFGNLQRPDNFTTPVTSSNVTVNSQVPSPAIRRFTGWNWGAKLSFNATPEINGFLNFTDARATIPGSSNSNTTRPEAASTQAQHARIYNLKVNGLVSAQFLGELQAGRSESSLTSGPTSGDLSVSRWTNTGGGSVAYDNFNNNQGSERNRNTLGASGTYFLANMVGNHQIKAGVDAEKTFFPSFNYTTGTPTNAAFCPGNQGRICGATFTFNGFRNNGTGVPGPFVPLGGDTSIANRVPLTQAVAERAENTDRSGRGFAAYFQDTWKPIPRLTLNLGVRYDRNDYYNNQEINVLHFYKWQPRVSAALDVLGDGKNVVRGNYGLFYVDAALTLARLFDTGIISPVVRNYVWNTAQQTWLPRASNFQSGGQAISSALIDRPLKPTYDRDFSIAFERELFAGASVTASYINKKTFDIYEDSFNEDIGDFWLTNQPGKDIGYNDVLTKDYYGYLFEARFVRKRFQGQASYTYSKSRGSIDSSGGQYAGVDFDYPPDDFVNRYGFLGDDARHRIKLFMAYQIPWIEANLGLNYTYRTGLPYNVTTTGLSGANTLFVEPRGTSRTPILQLLDVQLEKAFQLPFRQGLSVSVIGSVFNLTDSEQPLTIFGGVLSPTTFRTPATYQTPRRYEVGFRVDF